MRWAPFGPTPGRRPSSSMRFWMTPSYTSGPRRVILVVWLGAAEAEAGQVQPAGQVETAGHARQAAALHGRGGRPPLLLLQTPGRPVRGADRREHEIGYRPRRFIRVAGIHRGRGDAEVQQLALAVDRGL